MATVEKNYIYEHGGPAVYVDTPEPRKEHHEEYIPPEERSLLQAAIRAVATAEGEEYGLSVEEQLDALRFGLVQLKRVLLARNVRPDLFPLGSDCGVPCGPFKVDQPEHRQLETGDYDETDRPSFERLRNMLFSEGVEMTDALFELFHKYEVTQWSGIEAANFRQDLDTRQRKELTSRLECELPRNGYFAQLEAQYCRPRETNAAEVIRLRQCLRNIDRLLKPPF